MPSYPTSPHSFADFANGALSDAPQVNDIYDEVEAIEAGLLNGTARLNSSNSTLANLSVPGGSTLAGTLSVGGGSTFGAIAVFSSGVSISTGKIELASTAIRAGDSTTAFKEVHASSMYLRGVALATPGTIDAVRVELDAVVELAVSTQVISWTRQVFVTNSSMHSTATNPGRLTPQSTGVYLCEVSADFRTQAGGRFLTIEDSSGGVIAQAKSGATGIIAIGAIGLKRFDVAADTQWARVVIQVETSTNSLSTGGVTHFGMTRFG